AAEARGVPAGSYECSRTGPKRGAQPARRSDEGTEQDPARPGSKARAAAKMVRLLWMLDGKLVFSASGFVTPAQVVGRVDVVVLVADRARVERDPEPRRPHAVSEIDVLAAEQPVPGEADVEAAESFEHASDDRALAGEEVVHGDLGVRSGEALPALLGPQPNPPAEQVPRRVRMQRDIAEDEIRALALRAVMLGEKGRFGLHVVIQDHA